MFEAKQLARVKSVQGICDGWFLELCWNYSSSNNKLITNRLRFLFKTKIKLRLTGLQMIVTRRLRVASSCIQNKVVPDSGLWMLIVSGGSFFIWINSSTCSMLSMFFEETETPSPFWDRPNVIPEFKDVGEGDPPPPLLTTVTFDVTCSFPDFFFSLLPTFSPETFSTFSRLFSSLSIGVSRSFVSECIRSFLPVIVTFSELGSFDINFSLFDVCCFRVSPLLLLLLVNILKGFALDGGDVSSVNVSSLTFSSTIDFIRNVEAVDGVEETLISPSVKTFGMSSLIFFVLNDAFVIKCFASWPGVEVTLTLLWLGPWQTDNRLMDDVTMRTDGHALAEARSSMRSSSWLPCT